MRKGSIPAFREAGVLLSGELDLLSQRGRHLLLWLIVAFNTLKTKIQLAPSKSKRSLIIGNQQTATASIGCQDSFAKRLFAALKLHCLILLMCCRVQFSSKGMTNIFTFMKKGEEDIPVPYGRNTAGFNWR